jgi:hypothetical protein
MKRNLLTIAVVGLAMLTASEAFAGPFGLFRWRREVPVAPQATVTARDGYRTYSYEPGMTAEGNRAPARRTFRAPYLDARSKALGQY